MHSLAHSVMTNICKCLLVIMPTQVIMSTAPTTTSVSPDDIPIMPMVTSVAIMIPSPSVIVDGPTPNPTGMVLCSYP